MNELKVLVACETSGIVRDAFFNAGHDAWSCDILPADTPTNRHLQGDVREVLGWDDWDLLMVAHPPCTRLCNSGVRWIAGKAGDPRCPVSPVTGLPQPKQLPKGKTLDQVWDDLHEGAALFRELMNADVPMICMENPAMHKYAKKLIWGDDYESLCEDDGTFIRTSVQPWQFAETKESEDYQTKHTNLWLKGLPELVRTNDFDGKGAVAKCHSLPPSADRWKERSKFHEGLAKAMADQWGGLFIRLPKFVRDQELERAA